MGVFGGLKGLGMAIKRLSRRDNGIKEIDKFKTL